MDAEEIRKEKIERIERAMQCKEPDRVPILVFNDVWCGVYSGYTAKELYFEYDKWIKATLNVAKDFDFDYVFTLNGLEGMILFASFIEKAPEVALNMRFFTAQYHDILQDVYTKWPGRELREDAHPQFIGKEIMKKEEYNKFIEAPMDFIHEVALPRICKSLANPGSYEYNAALTKLGLEAGKYNAATNNLIVELMKIGYPMWPMAHGYAPLDFISDFLRDIKNIIIDLYRIPDVVAQAVEAIAPYMINSSRISGNIPEEVKKMLGVSMVWCFYPLHLNEYLNPKLYNEYYWPSLLQCWKDDVKRGLTPFVLFEGRHDAHLETLLEIPKKKIVGMFEKTDGRKVKELVGNDMCIMYGPPNTLLASATPEKVYEWTKDLVLDMKEGGGFILFPGVDAAGISREAKLENIKAMIEAVYKYGQY